MAARITRTLSRLKFDMQDSESEIYEYFDALKPRDRGVVLNRAMGFTGWMAIVVLVFPILLSGQIGRYIGHYLGFASSECQFLIALIFVLLSLNFAFFIPRFIKWRLRRYYRNKIR